MSLRLAQLLAACLSLAVVLSTVLVWQWHALRLWRAHHEAGEVRHVVQAHTLALLHALPAAVIGTDQDCVVHYLNTRAATLSGLAPGDGLGAPVSQLLPLFH